MLHESQMRIAIIHNTGAGEGTLSSDELALPFLDAGHAVVVHGQSSADIIAAIDSSPHLLVVAGGDGTVSKAAKIIFEHAAAARLPLLPLPLGTANNLARSLGVDADVTALARSLDGLERVRLDVGRIAAPWGEKSFVESAGVGVLGTILEGERSRALRLTRAMKEAVRPKHLLMEKRVEDFAREVGRAEPMHFRIRADNEDLSGEYIEVAAMNIRTIGPILPLAPGADPGDGALDLLLVGPADREALAKYVAETGGHAADGGARKPPGIRRLAREVELSWPESGGHVDDEAWPEKGRWVEGGARITIAGSIEVWRPRG